MSTTPTQKREASAEPVSEFVRFLISRWESENKFLKDLALAAGMAKSMPSQIKARTSQVTFDSAGKLAKAFGYADVPDLVNAAYAWWRSDRTTAPESAAEAPLTEAVRLALEYRVTQEQIDRVISRFPAEAYKHKDALWWLSKFHEERTEDLHIDGELRAQAHAASSTKRRVEKHQTATREVKEALQQKAPSPIPKRRQRAG